MHVVSLKHFHEHKLSGVKGSKMGRKVNELFVVFIFHPLSKRQGKKGSKDYLFNHPLQRCCYIFHLIKWDFFTAVVLVGLMVLSIVKQKKRERKRSEKKHSWKSRRAFKHYKSHFIMKSHPTNFFVSVDYETLFRASFILQLVFLLFSL